MPLPPYTTNLAFWLDARDIAGVADNTTISTWADSSGNSHTATISAGTATYRLNQYNGNPALTLASCKMSIAGAITSTGGHTSFLVYKLSNAASANQFWIGQQASAAGKYQHVLAYARNGTTIKMQGLWQDFQAFGGNYTGTAGADTNWHQAVAQQSANVSVAFRLDRATDTTITGGTLTNPGEPDAIGDGASGGFRISGQLMVAAYYNAVLALSDIQTIEASLAGVGTIQPQIFVVTRSRMKEAARKVRYFIPSILPDFSLQPTGLWAR